ncbi:hypothetical protein OK074_0930 [Actinobacteria bacterium OK074]|nr:hypothetical protein OK074_0930 [Actinobacteria bacterium OK074]
MLIAVAGYLVVQYVNGGASPTCTVVSGKDDGQSYDFSPEQAVNAATISAVGTTRDMPERAVAIALATAIQESGLRNISHGDLDSLGLFQQRPSQGWGTKQQILDPTYAASVFYEHLAKIPDYQKLPLTEAAQEVQRSGFPEAYAKHEPDATLLAAALTGHSAATLTCEGRQATTATDGPDAVRAALVRDFGPAVLRTAGAEVKVRKVRTETDAAGSASGTARVSPTDGAAASSPSPSPSPSASPAVGSVTIPVPKKSSGSGTARQRGWELAHWAVANSAALHIAQVSYAGREWARGNYETEWSGGSAGGRSAAEVRIVTGP